MKIEQMSKHNVGGLMDIRAIKNQNNLRTTKSLQC